MIGTLLSLVGLTAFAVVLTIWVYAPSQRDRWDSAANALFEETE
ncbi:MAG: hypothetical protein AAF648_16845 [Pseudomonadota bacterium]